MNTFLAIMLGLLAITAHELGHYEAMRRCSIRIKEVSLLGLPVPFLPSIHYTRKETVWGVHLFVIGAYVEAYSADEIKSKRLWDQLYVSGSGPIANIVYALALVAIAECVASFQTGQIEKAGIGLLVFGSAAGVVWLARRYIALVLPVLTIPILALIGYIIFGVNPITAVEGGSGGPIAVIANLTGAGTVVDALLLAASLSISLGIINLAPLPPFDGGRIFGAILKTWFGERFENAYNGVTIPFFVLLVVYFLGLDAIRIWKWVW